MTGEDTKVAKILIVDDDPRDVLLLREVLHSAGYEHVLDTTDPRRATGLYVASDPDLVILDMNMPHLDGFGVMERLREVEEGPYIPVLVLTGDADPDVRHRALRLGARDFLDKPFDVEEALARVRNLIELRLLHKELRNRNGILEDEVRERTAFRPEALRGLQRDPPGDRQHQGDAPWA